MSNPDLSWRSTNATGEGVADPNLDVRTQWRAEHILDAADTAGLAHHGSVTADQGCRSRAEVGELGDR